MSTILTIIISGISLGSLYAMMAIGLAIVYGILKMYNFAHGSLIMLGAYITWALFQNIDSNIYLCVFLTFIIVFCIGLLLEKILIDPFLERDDAPLIVVITTLACMILLDNGANIIWGPRIKQLPALLTNYFVIGGQEISGQNMLFIIIAPLILIFLNIFLKYTKLGCAFRAVSQNREASLLIGINVSNIYMLSFALSAVMAALGGILMSSIRFITPTMGSGYLLKALVIVLLGGLGSMTGTLIAAYLVGLIEAASTLWIGIYWTPAFIYAVAIFILTLKPQGIMGGK